MDVRKTVTDTGYIAIGLGVMGVQRAQERTRTVKEHVSGAGDCLANRGRDFETRAKETVTRVHGLGTDLTSRVEPLVEQVQSKVEQVQTKVSQVPEKVVQAMEPVTARVRERLGTAAA